MRGTLCGFNVSDFNDFDRAILFAQISEDMEKTQELEIKQVYYKQKIEALEERAEVQKDLISCLKDTIQTYKDRDASEGEET